MVLGRSYLLLAVIPTGAALIGLLWLKRRRSKHCHHHTDPGGSSEEEEPNNCKIRKKLAEKELSTVYCIQTKEKNTSEEGTLHEKVSSEQRISECPVQELEKRINKEGTLFKEKERQSLEVEVREEVILAKKDICEEVPLVESNSVIIRKVDISIDQLNKKEEIRQGSVLDEASTSLEELVVEREKDNFHLTSDSSDDLAFESAYEESLEINSLKIDEEVEEDKDKPKKKLNLNQTEVATTEEGNRLQPLFSGKVSEIESVTEVLQSSKIGDLPETIGEEIRSVEQVEKVSDLTVSTDKENNCKKESETSNMKTGPTQLAEKLASLELDTMKIRDENGEGEQKVCTERDSANHSPSEVMLASPSISNFSDAHSEGSSDSGKGHSDVATSPSRTPAGGSSLAGDIAPSIYEFILPQVIVGRLIGRRGTFLHEIRTSTQTNIYIKRHPDTNKLKICAIEGSPQDIDKALAKIRQKFPLRRFPQLTLEKVSFVTLNPAPSLKLEDFHLQLVEGVNNDVVLSSLITVAHFFLQQPSHPTYASLGTLNEMMNQLYSTSEAPTLDTPVKDAVCAAPTMGGWYRAQIVSIDEDGSKSTVKFLDYGGYLTLDSSNLRQIRADLLALPFQAVECYLANVAPADEEGWAEEARIFVHNLTLGQVLQAQIYDYAEDGTPLVYLYASFGSQVVLINEELILRGYGVLMSVQDE